MIVSHWQVFLLLHPWPSSLSTKQFNVSEFINPHNNFNISPCFEVLNQLHDPTNTSLHTLSLSLRLHVMRYRQSENRYKRSAGLIWLTNLTAYEVCCIDITSALHQHLYDLQMCILRTSIVKRYISIHLDIKENYTN